jgi:hypothetical protein
MDMAKDNKVVLSVRVDPDYVAWLDEVCERGGVGRGEVVQRCLGLGLANEQALIAWMDHPIRRPILKVVASPLIAGVILKLIGSEVDDTSKKIMAHMDAERHAAKVKGKAANA